MKELMKSILQRVDREDTVLVTIIAQTGSTPRGTGTHMLVGRQGRLCGTVGGGLIEAQSIQQAIHQLDVHGSCRVSYALDGASKAALDMVCGGGVEILFSYIGKRDPVWQSVAQNVLNFLTENRPATLTLSPFEPPILIPGVSNTPFGGRREGDRFVLPLPLQQRVIIFGGGHVAQALVPILVGVDFRVTVFENRPGFANPALFPGAEQVILGSYEAVSSALELREDDFYIIMTHGHGSDFLLQEQLLRRAFAYLGVMGSRRKTAAVNSRLREAGISDAAICQVHTPIGLAIQAITPAEIAISVAAECIAVRAQCRNSTPCGCPSRL